MSGPSKSSHKEISKDVVNATNSQRKGGTDSVKTEGQNIYVFTPSKLKELGFVTKVEDGKTVLIKGQSTAASILKHAIHTEVEKGTSLLGMSSVFIPAKPSTTTAESPGRRRIIQGFSRHWAESLKKDGFIKCPLRLCTFISLRHEDMCTHYIICNGLANNTEFLCPTCKCCLKTNDDLQLHIERTHNDSTVELKIVESPRKGRVKQGVPLSQEQLIVRKRGYSKVHKQAWTISLEEKGYVKCIFQNCIFMALTVEEMIEHYRCCNSKGLDKLFVCPHCDGGVRTEEKLRRHVSKSHGGELSGPDKTTYKAVTMAEATRQQAKPLPVSHKADSLRKLTTNPHRGMATERWNSFLKSPTHSQPVADKQSNKLSSTRKGLSPTKRPCYAPEIAPDRQPQEAPRSTAIFADERIDTPVPRPQTSSIPTASGQVCTFFKRRPDNSAVELFPPKVCTFVKNSRLSNKRRLSVADSEHSEDGGSKRSRTRDRSPGSGGGSLVIDIDRPAAAAGRDKCSIKIEDVADAGEEEAVQAARPACADGVDYYISESSREVVYQEEIAEEPEYIISDAIDDTEQVTESVGTVEIKYFQNVAEKMQEGVQKKTDCKPSRNETKRQELHECKQEIVAADVSKDEINISTNDGIDCSRFTENINLKQLPFQIADNFVSDPLASDLVEGPDNVQTDLLITHTEVVAKPPSPESVPFPVATESNALTRNASLNENLRQDLCMDSIKDNYHQEVTFQKGCVVLKENNNVGPQNEAIGTVGTSHHLRTESSSAQENKYIELNLSDSVVENIEVNESNAEKEDNGEPPKTRGGAAEDEEPGSHVDVICDVENNSDCVNETLTPRASASLAADVTNDLESASPDESNSEELGLIGNDQHASKLATTRTPSVHEGQRMPSKASLKDFDVEEISLQSVGQFNEPDRGSDCPKAVNDATFGPDYDSYSIYSSSDSDPTSRIESKAIVEADGAQELSEKQLEASKPSASILGLNTQLNSGPDTGDSNAGVSEDNRTLSEIESAVENCGEATEDGVENASQSLEKQDPCVDSVLDTESMSATNVVETDTVPSMKLVTRASDQVEIEDSVLKTSNLASQPIENIDFIAGSIVHPEKNEQQIVGENQGASEASAGSLLVPQGCNKTNCGNPDPEETLVPINSKIECQSLDVQCNSIKNPNGTDLVGNLILSEEVNASETSGDPAAEESVPAESKVVDEGSECGEVGEISGMSPVSATIEGVQWGRLRKVKMLKTADVASETLIVDETDKGRGPTEDIQSEQTGTEIGAKRLGRSRKETVIKNTGVPSTEQLDHKSLAAVSVKDELVQGGTFVQPPKKRGRPKKVVIPVENSTPTSNVFDATNFASTSDLVVSETPQASESAKPIKKRGRRKKEAIAVDDLPSTSHPIESSHTGSSAEQVVGGAESVEESAPIAPIKKRGRPKKEDISAGNKMPPSTPTETIGDGTSPAIVESALVNNDSVETSPIIQLSKRRGRFRKNAVSLENSSPSRKSIESEGDGSVPGNDTSVQASSSMKLVKSKGQKKDILMTPEESAEHISASENLIACSEDNSVKPAVKRGRRSKKEISETSDVGESVESSPSKPATKRGKRKKEAVAVADVAGDLLNEPTAMETEPECGTSVDVSLQPVGKRGQKRKLTGDVSEDISAEDAEQESVPEASVADPIPNDVAKVEAVAVVLPKRKFPKKRGRWTKRTADFHAADETDVPGTLPENAPSVAVQTIATTQTNSNGRGKKSAIAKLYEENERARGSVSQTDQIKCGKCELGMLRKQFLGHNKTKHCGLGWIDGEMAVDMSNLDQVRYCLTKTYNKKGRKEITCEVCKTSKKSVEGYMAHIELFCQKSTAEQEAMKVACTICGRVMLPTSLKVHMGVSHKSGLPDEPVADDSPRELGKRAAATKAAQLIAYLKSDEIEAKEKPVEDVEHARAILNKELMVLYKKKGGPRKVNSLLNTRLKRELETHGTMICKNPGCVFETPDFESMQMHYEMCEKIPSLTFRCKKCGFKCSVEEEIKDHVVNAPGHNKGKENPKEAEDSDFPDEGSVCTDPEDVDSARPPGPQRRSALFNLNKNARLAGRVKFLSKEISTKVMGDTMYLPTSKWWLQFQTENFQEALFPAMRTPFGDMKRVEASVIDEYLPKERESIPLAMLMMENPTPRAPKSEPDLQWKRLKLFEAAIIDDVPVLFVGGPIWAMAWCPIPTPLLLEARSDVSQFLAVSCHRGMDDVYTVSQGHVGNGIIQIWDFGHMDHSNPCGVPRMALALAHEAGAVWHMEWCPSGCYDADPAADPAADGALRRMGLLAAACSDGRVHVFAVPFPSELPADGDGPPVYRAAPVLSLAANGNGEGRPHEAWMCTRLSWFKSRGHALVAASFTNGMVSLWDVSATSPLLARQRGPTRLVSAYKTFQAHMGSVTALSLFPYLDGRYLMTGGVDRHTKIWDLQQTQSPIASSFKGVVTDGIWLTHWVTTVTAYDDGFGIHHGNTMIHSVRNFGFNPYPLLPQNSPVWSVSGSDWSNAVAQGTAAGELCVIFPHQLFIGVDVEKSMKDKRMVISYVDLLEVEPPPGGDPEAAAAESANVAGAADSPPTEPGGGDNAASDVAYRDNRSVASSSKVGSEEGADELADASAESDESSDGSSSSGQVDDECGDGNESAQDNASVVSMEDKKYGDKVFLPGRYGQIVDRFKLALCNYPVDNFKVLPNAARDTSRTSEHMRPVPREMYPITAINRVSWNPNCSSHLWLASGYHCGFVRVPCLRGMQNAAFARELFSNPPKKT